MIKVVIAGASGRMGQTLISAVLKDPSFELFGLLEREGHESLGKSLRAHYPYAPDLSPTSDVNLLQGADALIDFTRPEATLMYGEAAARYGAAHIIGTTGFSEEQNKAVRAFSEKTVVVKSGNMSLGVNLLCYLAEHAARALPEGFDIEILETHHRHKVDAPSGTALMLGEAAAKGRGISLQEHADLDRHSAQKARTQGDIGFATLRGGSVVGEHSVLFLGAGERLTLSHSAEDRSLFANGALKAAAWGFGKDNGLYSMRDVLGLV